MTALALTTPALSTALYAQAEISGTIHGRVLNAATGQYLNNARVVVENTSIETFTNQFGEYRLTNVPAGTVTVRVTYTGQSPETFTVTIADATPIQNNVTFNADEATFSDDGTLVLSEFVVASDRFKNAQEIATNEERYSTNIKNVVGTDALGFVPDGNVGEFVKFLPGVNIGYGGDRANPSSASSIEVRGFGPDQTAIMVDGMPISGANAGSLSRETGLDTLSINNASRIEVIKVATPDMPAESAGGAINLVTKSAFEYARPSIDATVYFSFNTKDFSLSKEPGPRKDPSYHTLPSGRLSVAVPVNEKFGFTVSIGSDNRYGPTESIKTSWQRTPSTVDLRPIGGQNNTSVTDASGRTASLTNPYLTGFSSNDNAWLDYRQSGNIKLDWKPFTGLVLTGNVNYSRYEGYSTRHTLETRINSPIDWGSDYTVGRIWEPRTTGSTDLNTGNTTKMTVESFDKVGQTTAAYLKAQYRLGPLSISASASRSLSRLRYDDLKNGHFSTVELNLGNIGQMRFDGIRDGVPGRISILDRTGAPLDYSQLNSWTTASVDGKTANTFNRDIASDYTFDVRYQLDFLPFDLAIKAGGSHRTKEQKKWGLGTGYTYRYVGPTALTAADLLDPHSTRSPGYDLPEQQWASVYSLYDIYQRNPEWFSDSVDTALKAANYRSTANTQRDITETSNAYYGMVESKLLNNRLNIIAGGRKTERKREGLAPLVDSKWNYVKNADGSVYRDDVYRIGVKFDYSNTQKWDPATGERVVYTNPDTLATSTVFPQFRYTDDADLMARLAAVGALHPGHVLYGPNNATGDPTQANSNNNMEAAMLAVLANKEISAKASDPVVPQVQASYKITDDLTFKTAWSRSVALPNLEGEAGLLSGQGGFTMNEEADPVTAGRAGVIRLSNANLKPQKTTSWDFELSYYTSNGGKISVSYYYKDIENVWERVVVPSTSSDYALLLDSIGLNAADFQEWELSSVINGDGRSKNKGYEIDVRQNLGFLGRFGGHFDVFATYSHRDKKRSSESSGVFQILANSSDDSYSGGVQFKMSRFSLAARGIYVGENLTRLGGTIKYLNEAGETMDIIAYNYNPEEFRVNLEVNYVISKRYSFFASGTNVFVSERQKKYIDGAYLTPDYASVEELRDFGIQISTGIRARF